MGTIVPRKQKDGTTRYRAQIRIKDKGKIIHNESRTFSKEAMAKEWLRRREGELEKPGAIEQAKHKGVTLADLIGRYLKEIVGLGNFGRTKKKHLEQLQGMDIAKEEALKITSQRLVAHVQERRKEGAGPATVGNDLVWIGVVFKYARSAWGVPIDLGVLADARQAARAARLTSRSKRRDRRPTPEELEKLDAWFAKQRFRQDGTTPPMRLIMWYAIYSCRREEEICQVRREDHDRDSRTYVVRDMKHPEGSEGNDKVALLPPRGWDVVDAILRFCPGETGPLLPYRHRTISANFTRACKLLGIKNLRFHDLRHEGASRLAEDGSTIPEIQQVTLHESWSSLQIYVNMRGKRQRRVDFVDVKVKHRVAVPA